MADTPSEDGGKETSSDGLGHILTFFLLFIVPYFLDTCLGSVSASKKRKGNGMYVCLQKPINYYYYYC